MKLNELEREKQALLAQLKQVDADIKTAQIQLISDEKEKQAKDFVNQLNESCPWYVITYAGLDGGNAKVDVDGLGVMCTVSTGSVGTALKEIYIAILSEHYSNHDYISVAENANATLRTTSNGVTVVLSYANRDLPGTPLEIVEHDYTSYPTLDYTLGENLSPNEAIIRLQNFINNPVVTVTFDFSK